MKREDLKKLELSDEAIDKIMAMHGADVEKQKAAVTTAQAEVDGLKAQLAEASTTIEGFKKLDIDGIKAAADEWKVKAEKAQTDAAAQIAALKFDHALDGALTGAKVKNPKAVKALLNSEALKFTEADNAIIGLDDQLKKVRESDPYLFADTTPPPEIITGGNSQSVISDASVLAARKAAGLPV